MAKSIKQPVNKKKIIAYFVYAIVVVLLVVAVAFFFVKYMQVNKKYTAIPEIKNQQIIAKVGKVWLLPSDEAPTIFEVKNKSEQAPTTSWKEFLEKAENGDTILIYTKNNVAVIYRPSQNKVIKTDKADKLIPINVAILAPADLQESTAKQLQTKFANVSIVSKKAPKNTVSQGFVVDVSGSNEQTAKDLAASLGLTVGQLPEGETKPEGATLVVFVAGPSAQ